MWDIRNLLGHGICTTRVTLKPAFRSIDPNTQGLLRITILISNLGRSGILANGPEQKLWI
jgi:hypothetical protein